MPKYQVRWFMTAFETIEAKNEAEAIALAYNMGPDQAQLDTTLELEAELLPEEEE